MTNYAHGHEAEKVAAQYLQGQGFKIVDQNWRTRFCEIDIIAGKGKTIYFVEVKYRHTSRQGSGFEYITARKLKQMRFAAAIWVRDHKWSGDYQLAAAEVSGEGFQVTNFIDSIF